MKERNVNLVVGESQAQINDNNVTMSAPAQVIEGRTLVPLRFISEAFGCDVNWNNDTKTATVTLVNQTIEVPIGQKYAVINGDKSEVAVPAQLINARPACAYAKCYVTRWRDKTRITIYLIGCFL